MRRSFRVPSEAVKVPRRNRRSLATTMRPLTPRVLSAALVAWSASISCRIVAEFAAEIFPNLSETARGVAGGKRR